MAATLLSTLLVWTSGETGSAIGVRHDDAFLVIAASVAGILLVRMQAKPAWIAPGFAAFVQFRDIRQISDSAFDVGIGLWIGITAAVAATVLLIGDLINTIRADAPLEENAGS